MKESPRDRKMGGEDGGGDGHEGGSMHQDSYDQNKDRKFQQNRGGSMHQDNNFYNEQNKDRKFQQNRFKGNRNQEWGNKMGMPRYNNEDRINERLCAIGGPTYELPAIDMAEKKFSGRNRLFIGNLATDVTEEEVVEMFKPFGETSELFINREKSFGFIRLDFHANAEKAKRELDGTTVKGRPLKVRFAPNSATIKVKNLGQFVTNELLHLAFSVFGEIERSVVIVDDRGKSTGEGIVEFVRKPNAQLALKSCHEGCFFLTSSLRPVIAELHEQIDDTDGLPEKNLMKKNYDYHQARDMGPRFANPGSFEHKYGTRWKELHELFKQKELALRQDLEMEQNKLEAQMQFAKFESETEMLREQLRAREQDHERQKREWEERERMVEEQRLRNEEQMRRRQQENTLFKQAHQLSNILDQQEQALQSYSPNEFENAGDSKPIDPQAFFDRNPHYKGRGGMGGPSKRRRY